MRKISMYGPIHGTDKMNLIIYGLILFTILSRLLPHPYNFTSAGALSLFAGAFLPLKLAWLVPVFTLIVSDAVTGFYSPVVMFFVYAGFAVNTLVGKYLLQTGRSVMRITGAAVTATFIFYIISNFGMWLSGLGYAMTLTGLIECYINGIPFMKHSLAANIIYCYFLFGSYQIIYSLLQKSHVKTLT